MNDNKMMKEGEKMMKGHTHIVLIRKDRFQQSLFWPDVGAKDVDAISKVMASAKPSDLLALDVVVDKRNHFVLRRARIFTREVFGDIMAER